MKNKPFELFHCALTGIGYGIPATLLCMTLIGGYKEPIGELAVWTAASALIGLLSGLTFGSDRLSLPWAVVLHGLGTLAIAVGAAFLCGYSREPAEILKAVLPVFALIYAAIYGVNWLVLKLGEHRANRALREKE